MYPGYAQRRWWVWPLLLQLLCAPAGWAAGDFMVQVWGVDEGLPQSSVTDLAQTPDGYLWIGTLLGGISRFDGLRFTNFDPQNTPALASPGIRRLLLDAEGTLWINDYAGGLVRLAGHRFWKEELTDVRLGSLVLDQPGHLIFATLEGELLSGDRQANGSWKWARTKPPHPGGNPYYNADSQGVLWYRWPGDKIGRVLHGRFELMENPPGLTGHRIQALTRDDAGQIWVGTDRELARFSPADNRFLRVQPAPGQPDLSVRFLIPATHGRLWVAADDQLRLLATNQWQLTVPEWDGRQGPWARARSFRGDGSGGFWMSLQEEGLAHVSVEGALSRITAEDGLPSQLVQSLHPDGEGNLWTGYHRGGLVRVRQRLFHPVARPQGLLDTVVTSLSTAPDGAVWLGTASGSVARCLQGTCTNFTLPLKGSFCQDAVVCAGPDGRVWVGTGGNGLLVYAHGQFDHVLQPAQIPGGARVLLVSANHQIWLANRSGLFQLQKDSLSLVRPSNSAEEVVSALAEGPDHSLWAGTVGGHLLHWDGKAWQDFAPHDSCPASRFWTLFVGPDSTVWIGTMNQGLLRFRDGAFTRFTTRQGLSDDHISQVLFDGKEHFWLGSRAGLLRVSKSALEQCAQGLGDGLSCRVFGRGDGLLTTALTLEFQPSCGLSPDGNLWFGTANGATWTSPAAVGQRLPPPPVVVEAVFADGKPLPAPPGSSVEPGPAPANGSPLRVGPGVRTLEFHYTAPTMTAPELVRFRYKLDGVDSDWVPAANRRSVTYSHLPPGEYTFQVSACNSDGLWNELGQALPVEILPFFWQRLPVKAAAAALLVGGLMLGARSLTRRRMQRRLDRLERQRALERERARIAQDLHDDLGAGLTEISLTSDLAQDAALDPAESRDYVREIGTRARQLVESMDEIVWAVNPRNDSVTSLAAYTCQYAQRLIKPAGIRCRLDVQDKLPAVPLNAEQRYQLFLAFKEAVHNVVKHSKASQAELSITADSRAITIRLTDDGCGFAAGAPAEGADGLRNLHERLARLGGVCEITSQPQQGTRVTFRLPLPAADPPA